MKQIYHIFKIKNDHRVYIMGAISKKNITDTLNQIPNVEKHQEIDISLLPSNDRDFINCRVWDDSKENKISYDIDKVKEIQKNKWREARENILKELDVIYMRADESEDLDLKKEITDKKQQLRDVTDILLPDDFEGIINSWPAILGTKK